jgi:competence protein ComGC
MDEKFWMLMLVFAAMFIILTVGIIIESNSNKNDKNKQYIIKVLDENIEVVSYQIEANGTVSYKTKNSQNGIVGGTYIITEIPKSIEK